MKKYFCLLLIAFVLFLLFGCSSKKEDLEKDSNLVSSTGNATDNVTNLSEKSTEEIKAEEQNLLDIPCTNNSECSEGKVCLDSNCAFLRDLFSLTPDCTACRLKEATFLTSDRETYTVPTGQGGYTGAGSLGWTLMTTQKYCQGEAIVPVLIEKISYSKVLNEEYITLKKGETSKVIKHPTVKRVEFTLKLVDVKEECS